MKLQDRSFGKPTEWYPKYLQILNAKFNCHCLCSAPVPVFALLLSALQGAKPQAGTFQQSPSFSILAAASIGPVTGGAGHSSLRGQALEERRVHFCLWQWLGNACLFSSIPKDWLSHFNPFWLKECKRNQVLLGLDRADLWVKWPWSGQCETMLAHPVPLRVNAWSSCWESTCAYLETRTGPQSPVLHTLFPRTPYCAATWTWMAMSHQELQLSAVCLPCPAISVFSPVLPSIPQTLQGATQLRYLVKAWDFSNERCYGVM